MATPAAWRFSRDVGRYIQSVPRAGVSTCDSSRKRTYKLCEVVSGRSASVLGDSGIPEKPNCGFERSKLAGISEKETPCESPTMFRAQPRSEERRVGKECRSQWSTYQ